MQKIMLLSLLTLGMLFVNPSWVRAEDRTPQLQIIVHDSQGNTLPMADRVRMRDVSPEASDTGARIPRTDEEGHTVFAPQDFEDFQISGNNRDGETETSAFDGTVRLKEAHFTVELSLDPDGYPPQKYTITVSADEPASYIFVLSDY
ncbi:MAG: hypothetical protein WC352_07115 [Candidatus Omnitrophota bacterium]|jgi:hypothetical protein